LCFSFLCTRSNNPHPNVVQIFGAFQTRSKLCVVMEYVPRSLRDRRVVNRVDIVTVLADVARALVRLHSTGVIHRDVKARNVLITADYRSAKLADFGLARPLVRTRAPTAPAEATAKAAAAAAPDGHAPLTDDDNKEDSESRRAAQCAMTPRVGPRKYRAPEVEDGLPYGCPCDMYSFGVMVRELLDQLKRRVVRRYGITIDFLRELSLLCMRDNPGQRPSALEVLTVLQVHLREGHLPLISRTAPAGVLRTRLFGDPSDGGGEHGGHKRGRDCGEHRHSHKKRRSSREPSRSRTGTSDAVLRLAAEQGGPSPLEDLDSSDSKSAGH
jgi:serine/threonine-protein kinase 24/25/MST4